MNYQMEMEKIVATLDGCTPKLLLHSCCAPCSSAVLEVLCPHFSVTINYYNPNIAPAAEYARRAQEQIDFVAQITPANPLSVRLAPYEPESFFAAVKGLETLPEGGARCFACYALRLRHTALLAKEEGFDYFTSTLSISPHKNAAKLNEIGFALQEELGICYLPADFKKKNGFKRSTQLAAEHHLYRQDYCGCIFSKQEREAAQKEKDAASS